MTVGGVDRLRASFNANAFSGRLEGGYRFVTPWMGGIGLTPYAAGQFTTFDLPAYAEQAVAGANTFALNYAAKNVTASRSELGLRTDKSFALNDAILTLRGRAAWAHNFDTDRSDRRHVPDAAGRIASSSTARRRPRDAALVTGVRRNEMGQRLRARRAPSRASSPTSRDSYAGKGVARYQW